jgi:hypothetical protein
MRSTAQLPSTWAMKAVYWIGLAMVVCWGILWLGLKIAVGAIHLMLILGALLIGWGLLHRQFSSRHGI